MDGGASVITVAYSGLISFAASVGGIYATIRGKLNGHSRQIRALNKRVDEHSHQDLAVSLGKIETEVKSIGCRVDRLDGKVDRLLER
jgi:hypothetical protein